MVPPSNSRQVPARRSAAASAERPAARPSDDLTRDSVIQVALNMADTKGLDTVTIRGLAQHFGVTPMALYWHVKNKDELLEAMGDQVFAELKLPDPTGLSWDEHYRLILWALLEVLRAHPGSVELAGSRVLHNEAGRDLTELALSLLRGAGLSTQASADIARSSLQTMMMLVSVQPGVDRAVPEIQWADLMVEKRKALLQLPVDRYPNLVECAPALVDCDDETVYYREGVNLFMSGVRAQVAELELAR